jgi:hypothetical protein
MIVRNAYLGPEREPDPDPNEPATTRALWSWLGYQYKALPEGIRVALMTVVLTVAQSVIATGGLAEVSDWGMWGRSLLFAVLLSLANLVWATLTPGKIITPK